LERDGQTERSETDNTNRGGDAKRDSWSVSRPKSYGQTARSDNQDNLLP